MIYNQRFDSFYLKRLLNNLKELYLPWLSSHNPIQLNEKIKPKKRYYLFYSYPSNWNRKMLKENLSIYPRREAIMPLSATKR